MAELVKSNLKHFSEGGRVHTEGDEVVCPGCGGKSFNLRATSSTVYGKCAKKTCQGQVLLYSPSVMTAELAIQQALKLNDLAMVKQIMTGLGKGLALQLVTTTVPAGEPDPLIPQGLGKPQA